MDVSFIIVSFNTKKLLEECLASVYKHAKGYTFEVIVIDNNSQDSSTDLVEQKFRQVKLIKNKKNLGFGKANNKATEQALGKYLFFLNSDAYLIDNSLLELLDEIKRRSDVGVWGTLILNPDRSIQQSVGFFPNLPQIFYWMSFLDDLPFGLFLKPYHVDHSSFYKKEREVDWVTGAAMIVKRKLFEKIGGFDPDIFMYGEDFEICYRIKKAGFKTVFSPKSQVVHLGRGSVGQANTGAIVGEYKGLKYFYTKYRGFSAKLILSLLLKFGAGLRILIFGILLLRRELLKAYFKAIFV